MKNHNIKFYDKTILAVTEEEANKVKRLIESGNSHIVLNGNMYATSSISSIEINFSMSNMEPVTPMLEAPPNPVKKETIERLKKEMAERFGWK